MEPPYRKLAEIELNSSMFGAPYNHAFMEFTRLLRTVLRWLGEEEFIRVWPTIGRSRVLSRYLEHDFECYLMHVCNVTYVGFEAGNFTYNKGLEELIASGFLPTEEP